ncbi:hypothetical protein WJX81_005739 [Elliptochloris bilobata]|uniref:Profilin n=1 Tax=Elliptochloris bilobata TaxID=381761 RepID=A0AAW1RG92_9CHLO
MAEPSEQIGTTESSTNSTVAAGAQQKLSDCSRVLVFDSSGHVLHSTFVVRRDELPALASCVGDRDTAVRNGLVVEGQHFEVHRHHPPLVYGRGSLGLAPEFSEGAAVCAVDRGPAGLPVYAIVTYRMPHVSARVVPLLQEFCREYLQG